MYKHVSYYKLNISSKCQTPIVKAKDTAFLTYSVGVRFKYQTRLILFPAGEFPQNKRSWNCPEHILQNLTKFKEHIHLIISYRRTLLSAADAAQLKISTYLPTHHPTCAYTSLTLYETDFKGTYSKYRRLCRSTYPNFVSSIYNFMKKSSSSTNENGGNMSQEWKIVSRFWPSSILPIAVTWGDRNKDGKVKSIIRFQRNRP